jgi:hypothetical protein
MDVSRITTIVGLMPRGSKHDLTGLLLENGVYPILRMPDGGEWRLDVTKSHRHLLGKRVRILGIRDDFDLLSMQKIEPS